MRLNFSQISPPLFAAAGSLALASCGGAVPEGAPAAFSNCSMCHSVEPGKNGIGPSLSGVFGAKAGHVGDFAYSAAMRDSGLVWDGATLDRYLKNPRGVVAGTSMSYAGLKDDTERAELVEWLKAK